MAEGPASEQQPTIHINPDNNVVNIRPPVRVKYATGGEGPGSPSVRTIEPMSTDIQSPAARGGDLKSSGEPVGQNRFEGSVPPMEGLAPTPSTEETDK